MCVHYYNRADAAQNSKDAKLGEIETLQGQIEDELEKQEELVKESTACDEAKNALDEIKGMIEAYANTFRNVGTAMEKVIVNGKAYENGRCFEIAEQINGIFTDFGTYSTTIETRINEIDDLLEGIATSIETKSESIDNLESDIADLDVTIGRRYWTCASCRQAIAKQSGMGPVALAE